MTTEYGLSNDDRRHPLDDYPTNYDIARALHFRLVSTSLDLATLDASAEFPGVKNPTGPDVESIPVFWPNQGHRTEQARVERGTAGSPDARFISGIPDGSMRPRLEVTTYEGEPFQIGLGGQGWRSYLLQITVVTESNVSIRGQSPALAAHAIGHAVVKKFLPVGDALEPEDIRVIPVCGFDSGSKQFDILEADHGALVDGDRVRFYRVPGPEGNKAFVAGTVNDNRQIDRADMYDVRKPDGVENKIVLSLNGVEDFSGKYEGTELIARGDRFKLHDRLDGRKMWIRSFPQVGPGFYDVDEYRLPVSIRLRGLIPRSVA